MPPPIVPYSSEANNTPSNPQRIQSRKGKGPATKSPKPVIPRAQRLTDEETLSLMKLALAHWGIRTRSCAEFFDFVEKEFIRVLGRPFATTRKKVHRAMKEYRENGTVLGESVNSTRSEAPLTTELRRVMQALTDAAAEEVGFSGRKGTASTASRRALEQYEDMEDEERDYEAERQARRSVLRRYVDQESPVSGLTNPRSGDEMDAASEDDGNAGHVMIAETSLPPSQAPRLGSTPRHDQSRETSASRARSTGLQQSRKRPREESLLADLVARLEEDQELRREELRRRLERDQEEREERERERENLRQEREHQRVMQQETHKMNIEMFKSIAEMMAKANSRPRGMQ
jgi:hypothetical protein